MASIRKHRNKCQVQIRRQGTPASSKSFINRKDAENWARQTEVQIDQKSLPQDPRRLQHYTLGQLVIRYRDTITPTKRAARNETIVLNAFLRHPICLKKLSQLKLRKWRCCKDGYNRFALGKRTPHNFLEKLSRSPSHVNKHPRPPGSGHPGPPGLHLFTPGQRYPTYYTLILECG